MPSCALKRRVQGYPNQKLYNLFMAWKPMSRNSEKIAIIFEHFFNTTMTEQEQQRLLNAFHQRKKQE